MRAVLTITSTAATRPPPFFGRRRWLTTPRRTPARIWRVICCLAGGKNSTSRPIVSAASIVCIVERTKWPDSAAWSAALADSSSRSSPIRITSGSWRSTRRSASMYESVSSPTSRWLTMQPQSSCTNSIGSSIVTMCCCRLRLIELTIAARVVDFPEPVAPVTRTSPRCSSASAAHAVGEAEPREARDLLRDEAECERDRAALPVAVDAEAAEALGQIGRVELAGDVEVLALGGRPLGDEGQHGLEVRLGQEAFLHRSREPRQRGPSPATRSSDAYRCRRPRSDVREGRPSPWSPSPYRPALGRSLARKGDVRQSLQCGPLRGSSRVAKGDGL